MSHAFVQVEATYGLGRSAFDFNARKSHDQRDLSG